MKEITKSNKNQIGSKLKELLILVVIQCTKSQSVAYNHPKKYILGGKFTKISNEEIENISGLGAIAVTKLGDLYSITQNPTFSYNKYQDVDFSNAGRTKETAAIKNAVYLSPSQVLLLYITKNSKDLNRWCWGLADVGLNNRLNFKVQKTSLGAKTPNFLTSAHRNLTDIKTLKIQGEDGLKVVLITLNEAQTYLATYSAKKKAFVSNPQSIVLKAGLVKMYSSVLLQVGQRVVIMASMRESNELRKLGGLDLILNNKDSSGPWFRRGSQIFTRQRIERNTLLSVSGFAEDPKTEFERYYARFIYLVGQFSHLRATRMNEDKSKAIDIFEFKEIFFYFPKGLQPIPKTVFLILLSIKGNEMSKSSWNPALAKEKLYISPQNSVHQV